MWLYIMGCGYQAWSYCSGPRVGQRCHKELRDIWVGWGSLTSELEMLALGLKVLG